MKRGKAEDPSRAEYLGEPPQKRMGHATTVFGSQLVVHGGMYGEDRLFLNDWACFDIDPAQWIKIEAVYDQDKKYQSLNTTSQKLQSFKQLRSLMYHSLTTVTEPNLHFSYN